MKMAMLAAVCVIAGLAAGLLAAWHCFRPAHTDRSLSFYQRGGHGFKTEGVPEKDVLRIGEFRGSNRMNL